MTNFSTPRGTHDVLPAEWPTWRFVLATAEDVARLHGYARISTPTLAETSLFVRTAGEASDIVSKEMYTFKDRSGEQLSLRPEGTAPIMRAYFQHGMNKLPQPVKLFYVESMFRYDKPQQGRYREHHQFGCEAIGDEDAYVDVEMISLLGMLYNRLGLTDVELEINSIGDAECRPVYLQILTGYLRENIDGLAALDRERLERNPLRVLDSKEPESQQVIERAPPMREHLCPECNQHWEKLQRGLTGLSVHFRVNGRLVRGLDYYTRTVFEFVPGPGGPTIGAGGRYDALATAMGAQATPGVGFGTGIERIALELDARKDADVASPPPDVYIVHRGEGTEDAALKIASALREQGLSAVMSFGARSMKAQMRHANSSGASSAVIVGEDELATGQVRVQDLRESSLGPWVAPIDEAVSRLGHRGAAANRPREGVGAS